MNDKSTWRLFCLAGVAGCSFVYGLIVATYKVFPYEQIVSVKGLFVEPPELAKSAEQEREIERYKVYYLDKKSFFAQQKTRANIVMIGDSLVDGAEWAELLNQASIANRGIAGDSIEGVLNRMDSIHSVGAKQAFIMLGYNDLRKSVPASKVFADYKKIIEDVQDRGAQPIIQSTLFTGKELTEWNSAIAKLNRLLEKHCDENGLVFIDLNAALAANGRLASAYTTDGLHLNGEGYEVWARAIKPYID